MGKVNSRSGGVGSGHWRLGSGVVNERVASSGADLADTQTETGTTTEAGGALSPIPYPLGGRGKGAAEGGCRPDSVPRRVASIPLGLASPRGSSSLPGGLVRACGRRG